MRITKREKLTAKIKAEAEKIKERQTALDQLKTELTELDKDELYSAVTGFGLDVKQVAELIAGRGEQLTFNTSPLPAEQKCIEIDTNSEPTPSPVSAAPKGELK